MTYNQRLLCMALLVTCLLSSCNATYEQILRDKAAFGDGNAACQLAQIKLYQHRFGEAYEWARKSADAANVCGLDVLATMYSLGGGVSKDPARAVALWRQAAALGDAEAMFNLALLYEVGNGVPKDMSRARQLLRQAMKAGHPDAENELANTYMYSPRRCDFALARKYLLEAYRHGDVRAGVNLGHLYYAADTMPHHFEKALYWYKRTSFMDQSADTLGLMYLKGQGVQRD